MAVALIAISLAIATGQATNAQNSVSETVTVTDGFTVALSDREAEAVAITVLEAAWQDVETYWKRIATEPEGVQDVVTVLEAALSDVDALDVRECFAGQWAAQRSAFAVLRDAALERDPIEFQALLGVVLSILENTEATNC